MFTENPCAFSSIHERFKSMVDNTSLRVNQAFIVTLLSIAFVLDQPWLVAAVGLIMLVGTVYPPLGLFQLFYRKVLLPAGLLRPMRINEDPAAPRFAQGVGSAFLLAAALAFALKVPVVGWALTLIVVTLALVNLLFGFCTGCFIYFQLERAGLFGKAGR
jgi:hypothetical protein